MEIEQKAYQKAIEVISACAHKEGFYASGLRGGYEAVWSRDSMITSIGACLVENRFKKPFADSLNILKRWQTKKGQIPNCVGSYNLDRRSDKTYNTVDSSLWYIIGHYVYAHAYKNTSLLKNHQKSIARALVWLKYQDPNEDTLITQLPTMDWQDAFPHKYGHVINTQALYYGALKMVGEKKLAAHLRKVVNGEIEKYLALYNPELGYYLPWNWKNHDGDREQEEWFDSLGNILAILTGLATKSIAESIISYIEKEKVNYPAPCKAIWPPIHEGDREWHSYFSKCDARTPFSYLNGGVWPFIGGFYVAALVKMNKFEKAAEELKRLAEYDMKSMQIRDLKGAYEFNEWIHGQSGLPMGEPYQGWTAGAYIYAYECVKQKRALFFED